MAILAQLDQNSEKLWMLIATSESELTHVLRDKQWNIEPDSKNIPWEVFVQFLIDIREAYLRQRDSNLGVSYVEEVS